MKLGNALAPAKGPAPPRRATIGGDKHFLAYITEDEAAMLREQGGGVAPDGRQIMGPAGVPAFDPDGSEDGGGGGEGGAAGGDDGGYGDGMGDTGNTGDFGGTPDGPDDGGLGGGGFDGSNYNGGNTGGGDGGPIAPSGPTGPTQAELDKQAAEAAATKLAGDRKTAKDSLAKRYGERFGDQLYDGREAAFRGSGYEGKVDGSYDDMLRRALGGIDPELRSTPIAHNIEQGLREQRDTARAGITPFWEGQETGLRNRAKGVYDAQTAALDASADPNATLNSGFAALDGLANEYASFMPQYQFQLDAGNAANGVVSLTRPGEQEQYQAERLKQLIGSLPPTSSYSLVT